MTPIALVPAPMDWVGVRLYDVSVLLVPHSNHTVVLSPSGFALPFKVTDVEETKDELNVATVGPDAA